jgi:putative copper resistance protein D
VALLVDIFGYLSIILHGLVIVAQSMTLGGVMFLVFLLRPFADVLSQGKDLERRVACLTIFSAIGLVLAELAGNALQISVLMATVDLSFSNVIQASFAIAGAVKILCALLLIPCLSKRFSASRASAPLALLLCAVELTAATFTTHAYARLSDNTLLLMAEWLHQFGAAIWIGGIPCFVMALGRLHDADGWRRVFRACR